mmetsp:Transcript_25722/g.101431  ORF Transcript_25722/g.101431 Transcript_25722/m.101431 type:complete len:134 (+) Transcript_25722:1407-1808(+)
MNYGSRGFFRWRGRGGSLEGNVGKHTHAYSVKTTGIISGGDAGRRVGRGKLFVMVAVEVGLLELPGHCGDKQLFLFFRPGSLSYFRAENVHPSLSALYVRPSGDVMCYASPVRVFGGRLPAASASCPAFFVRG